MEAVIDQVGRVLVPKALRTALGLTPGTKVDISAYGRGVQSTPGGRSGGRVQKEGYLVAAGKTALDDETLFALVDSVRR